MICNPFKQIEVFKLEILEKDTVQAEINVRTHVHVFTCVYACVCVCACKSMCVKIQCTKGYKLAVRYLFIYL